MKNPSFLEGVTVAMTASLIGSIGYSALAALVSGDQALRLMIAGIGLGYIAYLLSRSRQPVGRVATIALWVLLAAGLWFLQPSLSLYLLAHLGAIWLVRSLYFHGGPLSAMADLALNTLSLAAAVWAFSHSGSLFLAIWCLFLTQALFSAIPPGFGSSQKSVNEHREVSQRFDRAYRNAQTALGKLSSID